MSALRLIAGLVGGCASALAIAIVGFWALRTAWPEYAAAEPAKAYTLGMLFARLGIAAALTIGAACVATLVAGDNGRAAWCLGGLFVLVSLPSHLYYIWDDYPAWYHFVYLLSLIPIAGYSGRLFRGAWPASRSVSAA
jgi:hypothetical protein